MWGIPLIPLRRSGRAGPAPLARMAKRTFDVLAAAGLLMLSAPLLAVTALAVRLTLHRPALFRQVRVVGQGDLAEIVKLRTLGRHGDPDTSWAVPASQCGALGRFLRVTHIDELPQLVSVAARRHVPGRAAPGTAAFRAAVQPVRTGIRRAAADAGRDDRVVPGAPAERRHLDR